MILGESVIGSMYEANDNSGLNIIEVVAKIDNSKKPLRGCSLRLDVVVVDADDRIEVDVHAFVDSVVIKRVISIKMKRSMVLISLKMIFFFCDKRQYLTEYFSLAFQITLLFVSFLFIM